MAKLSQLQLGDAFGQGLNKLKKVSEALPAVDIAALKIEHVGFEARPFAYKVTPFPNTPEEFRAALRDTFVLKEQLAKAGASNAGAAMAILVRDRSGKAQLYAGVIFEGAAPDALPDGVALARTPGGPTLKVVYVGPYAGMRAVYAQLDAYVRAHRQQVLGEPWELYLDDPDKVDPSQARTEIYVPVK